MEKNQKIYMRDFPNHSDWILKLAKEDELGKASKVTKDVITKVMSKIDQGVDPQIAFKDACTDADLLGMEMSQMEKRTDIAAILYDKYEVDVNPVAVDKTPTEHPE